MEWQKLEYFGDSKQKIELIVDGVDEDGFKDRMQQFSDQYSNVHYKGFTFKPEEELAKADLLLKQVPWKSPAYVAISMGYLTAL